MQPAVSNAFGELQQSIDESVVERIAQRLLMRELQRARFKAYAKRHLGELSQGFVSQLVKSTTRPGLSAHTYATLVQEIEAILRLYPFNLLTGCQFYYLDKHRPSLFITVDANGKPATFDRTSIHRCYHVSPDLPHEAWILSDAESALDCCPETRFLLEVTLLWNSQFWYVDQTMHRKKPTRDEYQYRMLITDSYQETNRYDLHKLTDVKKLKLRGLFTPFPNSYSDNKIDLARWHRQQRQPAYGQQALWELLEIDSIPVGRSPPYNRQ